jgi:hypothetical protein
LILKADDYQVENWATAAGAKLPFTGMSAPSGRPKSQATGQTDAMTRSGSRGVDEICEPHTDITRQ